MILKFFLEPLGKRKKIKGIEIGKKDVELPLFADDMILHTGLPGTVRADK